MKPTDWIQAISSLITTVCAVLVLIHDINHQK